ncbi:MAG: hypothetical protein U9O98_08890 [Asgard group archaeon]|nr:hypothetical protein [Asgard group archaeon]
MTSNQSKINQSSETSLRDTTKTIQKNKVEKRIKKILIKLKPTFLLLILSFGTFLGVLVITHLLGVSIFCGLFVYIIAGLVFQPFLSEKFGFSFNALIPTIKKQPQFLQTTSKKLLLFEANSKLIGFVILRITNLIDWVFLSEYCSFFQKEGIIIQDCLEGCFLIIRKEIKKTTPLVDVVEKLCNSLTHSAVLTKKHFCLKNPELELHLVEDLQLLQEILFLGLSFDNFSKEKMLTKEQVRYLQKSPFLHSPVKQKLPGDTTDIYLPARTPRQRGDRSKKR